MLHKEFGYIFAGVAYIVFGSFVYMGWELNNMRKRSYKVDDNETMKELLEEIYQKKVTKERPESLFDEKKLDVTLKRKNHQDGLEPDIQLK